MKRFLKGGTPTILAAATQGFGLIQLLLLVGGSGATKESDAYFYLISWAQLPTQVVLSGYAYPVWLSASTPARRFRFVLLATPIFTSIGVVVGSVLFGRLSGGYSGLVGHTVLFVLLGVMLSLGWALALRRSAEGDTVWISSVTLVSNVLSCLVLLGALGAPSVVKVSAMVSAQLIGLLAYLILILARNRGLWRRVISAGDGSDLSASSPAARHEWFLLQAAGGYGAMLSIQTVAAALPASALSVLGLVGRFSSGLTNVVTNAIVPRLIHRESQTGAVAFNYLRLLAVVVGCSLPILTVVAALPTFEGIAQLVATSILVLAWFLAAALNATTKRVAVRFLSPRISLLSLALNISSAVALLALLALGRPTLVAVLLASISLDLLPGVCLAVLLRRPWVAVAITAVVIASLIAAAPHL
ncbi:hypothetical protein ET445_16590 [Agromyces protaetiae]|uniref:Polysaccharide biosynthesis protein n=1 Tax=Agromyces protaetiae TaxID=2509455 RepID=A0A4P6FHV8_9MICO|nr:hypothetical protein [Agromyces protaetiae]QAY74713.1 hypothetical protein ET445_16590 [Agromyces protaetiae]